MACSASASISVLNLCRSLSATAFCAAGRALISSTSRFKCGNFSQAPSPSTIGMSRDLKRRDRTPVITIRQIKENRAVGLDDYHAVIEATVQRTRPVILTALAAVLAFIPLTHSVFWGSMAYTLIGGTAAGTVLILFFLPALYALWFRIKSPAEHAREHKAASFGINFSFARSYVTLPRAGS